MDQIDVRLSIANPTAQSPDRVGRKASFLYEACRKRVLCRRKNQRPIVPGNPTPRRVPHFLLHTVNLVRWADASKVLQVVLGGGSTTARPEPSSRVPGTNTGPVASASSGRS